MNNNDNKLYSGGNPAIIIAVVMIVVLVIIVIVVIVVVVLSSSSNKSSGSSSSKSSGSSSNKSSGSSNTTSKAAVPSNMAGKCVTDDNAYVYCAGYDSTGGDMRYIPSSTNNIASLKNWCDLRKDCVGFNNLGWMKKSIADPNTWVKLSPDNAVKGLYYRLPDASRPDTSKLAQVPSGWSDKCVSDDDKYVFCHGYDSAGNDITYKGDLIGDIPRMKAFCDADSTCKGFNDGGWFKKTIKSPSDWTVINNANISQGSYFKVGN